MPTPKAQRKIVLTVLACAAIAAGVWKMAARPPTVRAVGSVTCRYLTYAWLTNRDLLLSWDAPATARFPANRPVGSYNIPLQSQSEQIDTITGRITQLAPLGSYGEGNGTIGLSPDRRFAVWYDDIIFNRVQIPPSLPRHISNPPTNDFGDLVDGIYLPSEHAIAQDGSGKTDSLGSESTFYDLDFTWDMDQTVFWDIRHARWVFCGIKDTEATIDSCAIGPSGTKQNLVKWQLPKKFGLASASSRLIGIATDGALMCYWQSWDSPPKEPSHLLRLYPGPPPHYKEIWDDAASFTLPSACWGIALAPSGDRIAWMHPYRDPSRFTNWLNALLRRLGIRDSGPDSGLWTSDVEGRHMRLVATWPRGEDIDTNLQWQPDGRHVSFDQIHSRSGKPAANPMLQGSILPLNTRFRHTIYSVAVP